MFTLKYVAPNGEENIRECHAVIADRTESGGHPRVLVFDEIPVLDKSNNSGVYCHPGESSNDLPGIHPTVYVMNRFGSTVATYRL
jgi:hypothetical protein